MNLYEALKTGTSAEELLDKFQDELYAAEEQLEEEERKARENEKKLPDARKNVADALAKYMEVLLEKDELNEEGFEDTKATILKCLVEFEKEIDNTIKMTKAIRDAIKSTKKKKETTFTPKFAKTSSSDVDAIRDFIAKNF